MIWLWQQLFCWSLFGAAGVTVSCLECFGSAGSWIKGTYANAQGLSLMLVRRGCCLGFMGGEGVCSVWKYYWNCGWSRCVEVTIPQWEWDINVSNERILACQEIYSNICITNSLRKQFESFISATVIINQHVMTHLVSPQSLRFWPTVTNMLFQVKGMWTPLTFSQHQCWTSLMLLCLNGSKSPEWRLLEEHMDD